MEERRRSCARILEGPIYCRKLRAQALVSRKRAHCRTVAAAMKLCRNAQGWAARKLGKRRLSCAGFRVRHAAVFQWIALRAAITRLVCRLSCGCGGRAGAFELIGPCALIWCLAFLRCDLYGDCAKRATVFDLIGLCAFSLFVALPLALWLRCAMAEIE